MVHHQPVKEVDVVVSQRTEIEIFVDGGALRLQLFQTYKVSICQCTAHTGAGGVRFGRRTSRGLDIVALDVGWDQTVCPEVFAHSIGVASVKFAMSEIIYGQ